MYTCMYVCSLAQEALRVQLSLCCKWLGSSSGLDSVNVTVLSHRGYLQNFTHIGELIFTH